VVRRDGPLAQVQVLLAASMEEALKDYLMDGLDPPGDDYTINVGEDRITISYSDISFVLYPDPNGNGVLRVDAGIIAPIPGMGSAAWDFATLYTKSFQLADPTVLEQVANAMVEIIEEGDVFVTDEGPRMI